MTIPEETVKNFTNLEQALYHAIQQNRILTHAILESLGYNIALGRPELDRLNATIYRYNKKVPEEDKLIHTSYGSTRSALLPVLMCKSDFEGQKIDN